MTFSLILLLSAWTNPAWSQVQPDVIYGEDGRLDLHQVQNPKIVKMAECTVALFKEDRVKIDPERKVAVLTTKNYGEARRLCPEEPFRDQNVGAFCSGSLVAPATIMTAGHCVKTEADCKAVRFVFGFGIPKAGAGTPAELPSSQVYGCAAIVAREQANSGPDWALLRLDRRVTDRAPLKLSRDGAPAKGTRLFVIGHPAGLPTKYAGGAAVRDPSPKGYFVTNLDTYGGNSGSAVFNAVTGEVEGILVRGDLDYVLDQERKCFRSNRVPEDGGRGEDVTDASIPGALIPKDPPGPAYSELLELTK
ncbi:MAG: serine protease [Elusimicrobiota bacterium]